MTYAVFEEEQAQFHDMDISEIGEMQEVEISIDVPNFKEAMFEASSFYSDRARAEAITELTITKGWKK